MASIYDRFGMLYLRYKDANKKWVAHSSGFRVGEEKQARLLLKKVLDPSLTVEGPLRPLDRS